MGRLCGLIVLLLLSNDRREDLFSGEIIHLRPTGSKYIPCTLYFAAFFLLYNISFGVCPPIFSLSLSDGFGIEDGKKGTI